MAAALLGMRGGFVCSTGMLPRFIVDGMSLPFALDCLLLFCTSRRIRLFISPLR